MAKERLIFSLVKNNIELNVSNAFQSPWWAGENPPDKANIINKRVAIPTNDNPIEN